MQEEMPSEQLDVKVGPRKNTYESAANMATTGMSMNEITPKEIEEWGENRTQTESWMTLTLHVSNLSQVDYARLQILRAPRHVVCRFEPTNILPVLLSSHLSNRDPLCQSISSSTNTESIKGKEQNKYQNM